MSTAPPLVLALNGGSSSLKFAVFAMGERTPRALLRGVLERIGAPGTRLRVAASAGRPARDEAHEAADVGSAVPLVFREVEAAGLAPVAVGHRVVHGGPRHLAPKRVDAAVLGSLWEATPFAPLHLPGAIALIRAVEAHAPGLPQVVCFDTGFFAALPDVAQRLPLPRAMHDAGIHRYGFHGLSYESIVHELGARLGRRAIVAHLGNGASMAALLDGRPVDTTMGLTPTGGLVMSTRTGDLDPGVVVHLARTHGIDPDRMGRVLDRESGLRAVSEGSSDMRELLAARSTDARADLAVRMFCYSARKWIGAFAAALGGLDTLVFTGGIGEHAAPVRAEICAPLAHLGIELDAGRNERSAALIGAGGGRCVVRVVQTDEECTVARHTAALVLRPGPDDQPAAATFPDRDRRRATMKTNERHPVDGGEQRADTPLEDDELRHRLGEASAEVAEEIAEASALGEGGKQRILEKLRQNPGASPLLSGGDVDAAWEDAAVGEESVGGDNPTPDQDLVDDLGGAMGIRYNEGEELHTTEKLEERDRHRWELDPSSREDRGGAKSAEGEEETEET